jgi:hypothetical protein
MKSLLIALSLAFIALCGGSQMLPYVQSRKHYVDVLEMHEEKRKAGSMSPHLGLSNSETDALYQAYLSYAPLVYKSLCTRLFGTGYGRIHTCDGTGHCYSPIQRV